MRQARWNRGADRVDLKYIPGVVAIVIYPRPDGAVSRRARAAAPRCTGGRGRSGGRSSAGSARPRALKTGPLCVSSQRMQSFSRPSGRW